jgi:hypothetical protein
MLGEGGESLLRWGGGIPAGVPSFVLAASEGLGWRGGS